MQIRVANLRHKLEDVAINSLFSSSHQSGFNTGI